MGVRGRLLEAVPNTLTLFNLLCGALATLYAAWGALGVDSTSLPFSYFGFVTLLRVSLIAILAGGVADILDGLLARALHVQSSIGRELDSLADLVTFGLAPSVVLVALVSRGSGLAWWVAFPLALCGFSALRLAKFNIDTRQSRAFRGLPTPAAALFVCGLAFAHLQGSPLMVLTGCPYAVGVWVVALGLLMVSEVPMLSIKGAGDPKIRGGLIVLALVSVLVIVGYGFAGLSLAILLYMMASLLLRRRLLALESKSL